MWPEIFNLIGLPGALVLISIVSAGGALLWAKLRNMGQDLKANQSALDSHQKECKENNLRVNESLKGVHNRLNDLTQTTAKIEAHVSKVNGFMQGMVEGKR